MLIAARRSAGRELSASSIASSSGSLRPGAERASISARVPESVPGERRLLLGGLVASVATPTELAAPWPGDVVVEIVLLPPQLHVPAAHGDIFEEDVEEDMAAGMSVHRAHRLIPQEPGSGVGGSTNISAEPAGSPVGSGSTSGRFDPRILSPLGQTRRAVRLPCCETRT